MLRLCKDGEDLEADLKQSPKGIHIKKTFFHLEFEIKIIEHLQKSVPTVKTAVKTSSADEASRPLRQE